MTLRSLLATAGDYCFGQAESTRYHDANDQELDLNIGFIRFRDDISAMGIVDNVVFLSYSVCKDVIAGNPVGDCEVTTATGSDGITRLKVQKDGFATLSAKAKHTIKL